MYIVQMMLYAFSAMMAVGGIVAIHYGLTDRRRKRKEIYFDMVLGILFLTLAVAALFVQPYNNPNVSATKVSAVKHQSSKYNSPAPVVLSRRIQINYDAPIEWLVENGNYAWRNSLINSKNFPRPRTGVQTIEVRVVNFSRTITTGEVFKELHQLGLWPANAHELLTLKLRHPEILKQKTIVALDSYYPLDEEKIQNGTLILVPTIYQEDGLAILSLRPEILRWTTDYSFAAVKE